MKNNKKLLFGIACFTLLFMVGCTNEVTENAENSETAPTLSMEEIFVTSEDQIIDNTETVDKQVIVENTETVMKNVIKTDYNVFNRMLRGVERESLLCTDWNTNMTYFVNQNKDWYIYCLRDGMAELVVSLPARELHVYDGVLYFIVEDYGEYTLEGINSGDIYAYTPAEGTVELVYEVSRLTADACTQMTVKEDGVYFSCMVQDEEYPGISEQKDYFLSFETKELVEDMNDTTSYGFGEYKLAYFMNDSGTVNMTLISKTQGTKNTKELGIGMVKQCCILENELFYKTGWKLGVLDLDTWTTEIYDYEAFLKGKLQLTAEEMSENWWQISDFTATEEDFWGIIMDSYLLKINRQTKEMECFRLAENEYHMSRLYTDGVKLYSLCATGGATKSSLAEIVLDEELEWSELFQMSMLRIKKLTE